MKIRCKNCYRVLDVNEEYCKSCGTHSEQMAKAMTTGDFSGGPIERFKTGLGLFLLLAFLGNGIIMTIFAVIDENATQDLYNRSSAMIFSSIITFIVITAVHYRDLKDWLWNGNKKQLLQVCGIGVVFLAIVTLLPLLSDVTYVLPKYLCDYLASGNAKWFSSEITCIFLIVVALVLIAFVEEVVFRRLLIDTLDDATLLGDMAIILLTGLISTILDFSWLMAPETLITSFLIHSFLSGVYANTNRSLGMTLLFRILIIIGQVIIFLN